ncbi:MAG: ChaN family lipoprotein [Saprospirales bacterium]|nr:ChaN family lipoprotein [Saprospirales bacterium]MBK8920688.1 ChaN family lipoprotein [Saprospirales bacterium]
MRLKTILLLCLFACAAIPVFAQQKPAYVLFNAQGRKVSYAKMLRTLQGKDIVLFGEYHNNAIAHWLQLELSKDLQQKRQLVLGAEMFEADNQGALNRYLNGEIDAKGLDTLARLWKNYRTDYAPLVDFAKAHRLPFAATNIPRRYASIVSHEGFSALDSLSDIEKAWIAPLPMPYDSELPGYKNMLAMMGGHGGENFPKAQASKDATMAHFILQYFRPGSLLLHFNGAYHSDNYEGILWYLKRQQPTLQYGTISTVTQEDLSKLQEEHKGRADFILCVDADMTPTY